MVTKWEKTGKLMENPKILVVYSTIKSILGKHPEVKKIAIIDDVMATGYTIEKFYQISEE